MEIILSSANHSFQFQRTWTVPTCRFDLRLENPASFTELPPIDFSDLSWELIGRPAEIKSTPSTRQKWEAIQEKEMPEEIQWEFYNRAAYQLYRADPQAHQRGAYLDGKSRFSALDMFGAVESAQNWLKWRVWNKFHRLDDYFWNPRGKRAMFAGLNLKQPRILVLGAGDGFDALLLSALYPGGETILVDADPFCKSHRFAEIPNAYPFLSPDKTTGNWRLLQKSDLNIKYVTSKIEDLDFGAEFDLVISSGLISNIEREFYPEFMLWHRKFLKPAGRAIIMAERDSWQNKLLYSRLSEDLNFVYRSLMTPKQLGKIVSENGFNIMRCSSTTAINTVIARVL